MDSGSRLRGLTPKGKTGLLLAIAMVALPVVAFPAYRWLYLAFLGISVSIGLAVAAILHFWHRLRPVSENDVEDNKRPLGLS